MIKREAFLGPAKTRSYRPQILGRSGRWIDPDHRGMFMLSDVERMRHDPQIVFGLSILLAPLATLSWEVQSDDPQVVDFVDKTLRKIWTQELAKLFQCVVYENMAAEVLYAEPSPDTDGNPVSGGMIQFDRLKELYPLDCVPLQNNGRLAGFSVKNNTAHGVSDQDRDGVSDQDRDWIRPPRSLWIANEPEFGSFFGQSRLRPAWYPWSEKTKRHGAVDVRRLWYVKNAFHGDIMRHPQGEIDVDGTMRSCAEYAREVVENFETGGVMALPNTRTGAEGEGEYEWVYEPAKPKGDLPGLHDYIANLDDEILRALRIPPEVAKASETGSGWAGRTIPFLVFLTGEDRLADQLVTATDQQIIRWLVAINFGPRAKYQIKLKSLVPPDVEGQGKAQQGGGSVADALAGLGGGGQAEQLSLEQTDIEEIMAIASTPETAAAIIRQRLGLGWATELGVLLAGEEGDGVDWLAGETRQVGDKWQGQSGRWFTKRQDGRVVPTAAPGGAEGGGKPKAPKADPAAVRDAIAAQLKDPSQITPESIQQTAQALVGLGQADINALKKELGIVAGGKKEAQARAIAEQALGAAPKREPKQPKPKAEPKPGPEAERLDKLEAAFKGLGVELTDELLGDPEKLKGALRAALLGEEKGEEKPKGVATPDNIQAHVAATFDDLLREKYSDTELVPIHELRSAVAREFGPEWARHDKFDDLVWQMRKAGKIHLTPTADASRWEAQQIRDGIPGVGEQLVYMQLADGAGSKLADHFKGKEQGQPTPKPPPEKKPRETKPKAGKVDQATIQGAIDKVLDLEKRAAEPDATIEELNDAMQKWDLDSWDKHDLIKIARALNADLDNNTKNEAIRKIKLVVLNRKEVGDIYRV